MNSIIKKSPFYEILIFIIFILFALTIDKGCSHLNNVPDHYLSIEREMKNLGLPASTINISNSSMIRADSTSLKYQYKFEGSMKLIKDFYKSSFKRNGWFFSYEEMTNKLESKSTWCHKKHQFIARVRIKKLTSKYMHVSTTIDWHLFNINITECK